MSPADAPQASLAQAPRARRLAVIASASGNGKTTLGRVLARRLDVPFVELDALVHGPGWKEISDVGLREQLTPILGGDGWVVDGMYSRKLGSLVLDQADLIVWLDLPIRVWLPRLAKRSYRRWRGIEPLWNGNSETLRGLFGGRDSLFGYAFTMHFRNRHDYPQSLSRYNVRRLTCTADVERFLEEF